MKKLRFLLVGVLATLTLSVGLFSGLNHESCVRAEDEITEVVEENETEEEIVEEEIDLSQIAKDSIEVIKTICNQPIVVGGISITLGTIILWAISKIVGSVSSKKTKKRVNELEQKFIELLSFSQDSIKKKDYNALVERYYGLVKALMQIAPTIKNIQVRENLISMLEDLKPILLEDKDFIENEAKEVVNDTKEQLEKNASDILTILNK